MMPPWASRRIGWSRQGHPRYTGARQGRPWVAHNTIHVSQTCTTERQTPLSLTTYMVAEPCSVQSAQPGSSSEQNVDELDKKLTDSLWAVASNRDREHKETRQAGGPGSRARSSSTKSRMRSYSSWKTNSAQLRTRVTHQQHSGDETAQHHPRAGRSQSVDGRQEMQRWIGHEPATNHFETVPNHHEDCAEKEFVHPEK